MCVNVQTAQRAGMIMLDRWMALIECPGWERRIGELMREPVRKASRLLEAAHGQLQEIGMNQDRVAGIWKQFRGKVKERWGRLADNPLAVIAGTRDQLAGRIQEQYGVSQEKAARQLEDFFDRNRNWDLSNR